MAENLDPKTSPAKAENEEIEPVLAEDTSDVTETSPAKSEGEEIEFVLDDATAVVKDKTKTSPAKCEGEEVEPLLDDVKDKTKTFPAKSEIEEIEPELVIDTADVTETSPTKTESEQIEPLLDDVAFDFAGVQAIQSQAGGEEREALLSEDTDVITETDVEAVTCHQQENATLGTVCLKILAILLIIACLAFAIGLAVYLSLALSSPVSASVNGNSTQETGQSNNETDMDSRETGHGAQYNGKYLSRDHGLRSSEEIDLPEIELPSFQLPHNANKSQKTTVISSNQGVNTSQTVTQATLSRERVKTAQMVTQAIIRTQGVNTTHTVTQASIGSQKVNTSYTVTKAKLGNQGVNTSYTVTQAKLGNQGVNTTSRPMINVIPSVKDGFISKTDGTKYQGFQAKDSYQRACVECVSKFTDLYNADLQHVLELLKDTAVKTVCLTYCETFIKINL